MVTTVKPNKSLTQLLEEGNRRIQTEIWYQGYVKKKELAKKRAACNLYLQKK